MLDKDTKVIQGISTGGDKKTYINAKYWGDLEVTDVKTIGGKSIFKESDSDEDNIVIHTDSIIETTYSDLKILREKSELIPGIQYKITDYVTTTIQENTISAGHIFDVIVTADSKNTLNENARVCRNNKDTYFSSVNLDAWKIKYCFDNDTNRFAWADETNGKGVIYYMKDEFNNEAYYDFKNIQYSIVSYQSRPSEYDYAFTFTNSLTGGDLSLTKNARNNVVKNFTDTNGVQSLNSTIFLCSNDINNNILEENSYNNLIWVSSFYYNNIGRAFQNNVINDYVIDVHNNIIGNLFKNNKINKIFNRNKIGSSVYDCIFNDAFSYNNMDSEYERVEFYYPVSYCDFSSGIRDCVFKNTDVYAPSVNEMKWCVFEGGFNGLHYIPSCQRVTFQKSLHTENSKLSLSEIKLIDGRLMSDVLTRNNNEHLYVYRVGDKFGVYKNSEEKIKTLTPLFSNPDLESTSDINCYGYVGNLLNLNVFGSNILIDSIGVYVGGNNSSTNFETPVWCRLLRYVNNTWETVSQSENCKSIGEIYPDNLFTFKMVNKSNEPLIKNSDKIAIVYVSSEDGEISSSVQLEFKCVSKPGALDSVLENDSTGMMNFAPAFVFGYTSLGIDSFGLNLGDFSNIDGVSEKSSDISVCCSQKTTRMTFTIGGSNGFIEQFISDEPYTIDGVKYYYTVQILYFNGEISSRKVVYTIDNDIKTIHDAENWTKIIDCVDTSVLYSRNSEVVTIESDQTITGNKLFDSDINIGGKTIIRKDVDNGELTIFNSEDETSGFTIHTKEKFDNGIPKLEILGTNNVDSYKYQFPQLENPNDTDVVVVKSQLDELFDIVKENEKVTAVALNYLNENLNSGGNVSTNSLVDIPYSELVSLRDSFGLKPGMQYKIVDYETTTSQENTQSDEHKFDIIVTADSENVLSEIARVCANSKDDYFINNRCNLCAWQIWYCLDNDIERFGWADVNNGKGVIYRMIDEWGNDCPYDFKNIRFKNDDIDSENYLYTFSFKDDDGMIYDASIVCNNGFVLDKFGDIKGVYNNNICKNIIYDYEYTKLKQSLNNIVFLNTYVDKDYYGCYNNTFESSCYGNIFGSSCYNNHFGTNCCQNIFTNNCYDNTFGSSCCDNYFNDNCTLNIFENGCSYNTLGKECIRNSFGIGCSSNVFGENCNDNIFGNDCCENEFSYGCDGNTFGNNCQENAFGVLCEHITFGNDCDENILCGSCSYISFSNGCQKNEFNFDTESNFINIQYIHYENGVSKIKMSLEEGSLNELALNKVQNITIKQGVGGKKISLKLTKQEINNNYELLISKNSSGELKMFCLADLLQ